jgi:phytoene dehydrogenase-like protein
VLVVERQDGPGGYAHAFRRGRYLFDPAIHVLAEGELVMELLDHLGVGDRCTLTVIDQMYRVVFPGFSLRAPSGAEPYLAAHIEQFPGEADAIRRFFGLRARLFEEAAQVPMQVAPGDLDRVVQRFPTLFKYRTATVGEAMDEFLTDERLKAVCATPWPYLGSPPTRLSFLFFAQMVNTLLGGSYYCLGSFQQLVDAFVEALRQHGGELVVNSQVGQIIVEDGRARGVRLVDGRPIRADTVISNADARQTFEQLVGIEHLPGPFARRLQRLKPSLSAFVVYAATDLDLRQFEVAHETFVYKHWDHERTYQDILAGQPGGMWVNVPTLADRSVAPPGEHLVIFSSLAPYDIGRPWEEEKARFTDSLLDEMEGLFPGIRDRLTFLEAATPETLERYTLNHRGAIYGWENIPQQTGPKRLSHQTPLARLYLSGHWTQEGASSFRTILSGINTARLVLAEAGRGEAIPTFRAADLPPLAQ